MLLLAITSRSDPSLDSVVWWQIQFGKVMLSVRLMTMGLITDTRVSLEGSASLPQLIAALVLMADRDHVLLFSWDRKSTIRGLLRAQRCHKASASCPHTVVCLVIEKELCKAEPPTAGLAPSRHWILQLPIRMCHCVEG